MEKKKPRIIFDPCPPHHYFVDNELIGKCVKCGDKKQFLRYDQVVKFNTWSHIIPAEEKYENNWVI